jgi:iron complex outermembrane receptor protein
MKRIIFYISFLLVPFLTIAQDNNIIIKLIDVGSEDEIGGATIFYNQKYAISDEQGTITISPGNKLSISLVISHVGYETFEKTFTIDHLKQNPRIELKSSLMLLEEVLISGDQRPAFSQKKYDRETVMKNNPKNIGDVFKDKSGFGLIKRGGYAMDPVFRSFKYEQLNLIYDGGVYLSGACPNRMDPASVQVSPAEIDRIELVKGPFSVRYGQTMGALINIITNNPQPVDELQVNGEIAGGYEVNGNGITGRGAISVVGKKLDFSLQGGGIAFDDYKNGDGELVPSSFETYNYATKFGFNPTKNQRLQLSWRQSFGKDIKHASLPMDSPKDNSSIISMDYGVRNLSEKLISLNAKAYYTYIDHLMTNENRPNFRMVDARSPVTSTTYGGRLELGLQPSQKATIFIGTDLRTVAKDGVRNRIVKIMNGNPLDPPREFTDLIWQDSWLYDVGVFTESNILINEHLDILLGARLDFVKSGADNPSPDFEQLYGEITPQSEVNFNLTGSVNTYFGQNGLVQLSLGRGQRAASLLERYINHFTVGMDAYEYVGNPYLESEVNYQADVTVKDVLGKMHWRANVFYSYLQNYISAVVDESIPRKFMPGTEPLYAKRYVNIDHAWQAGFDAEIGYQFTKSLSADVGGYYTYAQNVDFDEPLAEIPPLTGLASLTYKKEVYWFEITGRFVAEQDRVAASFDESSTPGFNVFDLMAGYAPVKNLDFNFALRNIFNANYFEHLSRPYKNQSEGGMFYEPGRSFRIGASYKF